jgi:hypothetical protein
MAYRTLGFRDAVGAADTTGNNKGNWTVAFTPALLNVQVTDFEIYKMILTGAASSASFNVYIDRGIWDTNVYGAQNSWEPDGGLLLMRAGQTLYLYYNSPSSDGHKPLVTAWLRYDVSLTELFPA